MLGPVLREIWRPFYAFGAMACVVVVAGAPAAVGGSSTAVAIVICLSATLLGLAGARSLIWRLGPARVRVTCDDTGLFVRRGAKLLCHYPWSAIQEVALVSGDRWPEWTRWAMFTHLEVISVDSRGRTVDDSPGILLVKPTLVWQEQLKLETVVNRYIGEQRSP